MTTLYNVKKIHLNSSILTEVTQDKQNKEPTKVPSMQCLHGIISDIEKTAGKNLESFYFLETITTVWQSVPNHPGVQLKSGSVTYEEYSIDKDTNTLIIAEKTVTGFLVSIDRVLYKGDTFTEPSGIFVNNILQPGHLVGVQFSSLKDFKIINTPHVHAFSMLTTPPQTSAYIDAPNNSTIQHIDITCADVSGKLIINNPHLTHLTFHGPTNVNLTNVYDTTYYSDVEIDSANAILKSIPQNFKHITLPTNDYSIDPKTIQIVKDAVLYIPKGCTLSYDIATNTVGYQTVSYDPFCSFTGNITGNEASSQKPKEFYHKPIHRYRLIDEEDYLMALPYRHKMNMVYDMGYKKSTENYDQTYKLLVVTSSTSSEFHYISQTEYSPNSVFVSEKIYDDDLNKFILTSVDPTFDYAINIDFPSSYSLLFYTTDSTFTSTNILDFPVKFLEDMDKNDYLVKYDGTKYETTNLSTDVAVKVSYSKNKLLTSQTHPVGFVIKKISESADTMTLTMDYHGLNVEDQIMIYEKDQNNPGYRLKRKGDIDFQTTEFCLVRAIGTYDNQDLEFNKSKEVRNIFISESIKGLKVKFQYNNVIVTYDSITDLSFCKFNEFNEKNVLYIGNDILNIHLVENLTIGEIHFYDDSLDYINNEEGYPILRYLNDNCKIYLPKKFESKKWLLSPKNTQTILFE